MYTKSIENFVLTIFVAIHINIAASVDDYGLNHRNHKKRQIYREQVLPHAGGRIPSTAFETDRLFLNRLQKEGIAVPDGVVFEQRNPQVYPFQSRDHRAVFRIALSSDARFVSKEGQYRYKELPSIETTYLYPQIHGEKSNPSAMKTTVYPVYRLIQLHNSQINQPKLQPIKKDRYLTANKIPLKPLKTTSYQNFNIIHDTSNRPAATSITPDYIAPPPPANNNILQFDSPSKQYLPGYADPFNYNLNPFFNNYDFYQSNDVNDGDFFKKDHIVDLPITGFGSSAERILY